MFKKYLSLFDPRKDCYTFVDSLEKIRGINKDSTIIIFGDCWMREDWNNLYPYLHIFSNVYSVEWFWNE